MEVRETFLKVWACQWGEQLTDMRNERTYWWIFMMKLTKECEAYSSEGLQWASHVAQIDLLTKALLEFDKIRIGDLYNNIDCFFYSLQ